MKRTETVMTYDEWCKVHRKTLRKMIKDSASTCVQWVIITILFAGLPVGMFAHWLLIGY